DFFADCCRRSNGYCQPDRGAGGDASLRGLYSQEWPDSRAPMVSSSGPVADSWLRPKDIGYNQILQRLFGRRPYPARGSNVHLKPEGSDAVLRRGNEPMRNSVFCEKVA